AALAVNARDHRGVERDGFPGCTRQEPAVTVADADDLADLVLVPQRHHERANHVVQARAQAAAGDDGGSHTARREEQEFARPSFFEDAQRGRGAFRGRVADLDVVQYAFFVVDEVPACFLQVQGRGYPGHTELPNREGIAHAPGVLRLCVRRKPCSWVTARARAGPCFHSSINWACGASSATRRETEDG